MEGQVSLHARSAVVPTRHLLHPLDGHRRRCRCRARLGLADPDLAYPVRLQQRLDAAGLGFQGPHPAAGVGAQVPGARPPPGLAWRDTARRTRRRSVPSRGAGRTQSASPCRTASRRPRADALETCPDAPVCAPSGAWARRPYDPAGAAAAAVAASGEAGGRGAPEAALGFGAVLGRVDEAGPDPQPVRTVSYALIASYDT